MLTCSLRSKEYHVESKRWDPLTAGASSTLGTITDFTTALGGAFIDPFLEMKRVRKAKDGEKSNGAAAAAAGLAAAQGLRGMTRTLTKATLVNMPLAFAEGFRNTPALYGDKPRSYEPVTDWKSGSVVGAKVRS